MSKDWGSKAGSGGVASASEANVQRRERLRQLAMETIDVTQDPYFMRNHLGSYECKLCLTLHTNEGSYLAHTQGKKHQQNLARRAAKVSKERAALPAQESEQKPVTRRKVIKIGRPGYKVVKQRDATTGQRCLLFQMHFPSISENVQPRHRFMSTFEQNVQPRDDKVQYLLIAAEPYETVAFAIPNVPLDRDPSKFFSHWDEETRMFYVQFFFAAPAKNEGEGEGGEGEQQAQQAEEAAYEVQEGEGGYSP